MVDDRVLGRYRGMRSKRCEQTGCSGFGNRPESGVPSVDRHSQPCRAGIVLKSGYGMLPQIGWAEAGGGWRI